MTSIGDSVDGKYDVIDLIGEGGMSRVWLARDKRLNKLWAVKEIGRNAKDANNTVIIQSLIAEANMMKQLDHPALPRIVDIIETDKTTYVVMDYIEGESLNKTMQRRGHPMPAEDVIEWGIQLCDVLGYLHKRKPPIIYRDMKPGNIMLREDGSVKLIDFGIAREYKDDKVADTQVLGTHGYAAPEQVTHTAQSDARTDIYALGATLYNLVTGRSPAHDPEIYPIRTIDPTLPEGLEYIIEKATQRDPEKRYQTCDEMRYDLERYEQLTQEYRSVQEAKLRKFRLFAILAIAFIVLGVVCLLVSTFFKNSTFDNYMRVASTASTQEVDGRPSEAEENYTSAVGIEPASMVPYQNIIEDVYKVDYDFSMEEAERWVTLFTAHQSDIEGSEEYAKLCYDVGTLYFVYYEQEDGVDTGRTYEASGGLQAGQWFERARESYEAKQEAGQPCTLTQSEYVAAGIYKTIGEFYQRLSTATLEGTEGEVYEGFWDSLEQAIDTLSDDDPVMVKLRIYQLAYQEVASSTHLNGFRRAGVARDQVESLLNKVIVGNSALEVDAQSSDKAVAIYEQITQGESRARENIELAYANANATFSDVGNSSRSNEPSNTTEGDE